ncbi:SOS response-associated peptidase family protein [Chitinophaga polysaccharea]|nr:SOS response-associated peptidase family protein [Chitinophaga polysaccharea]
MEYRWEADFTITHEYPGLLDANGFAHPHLPVLLNTDSHNIQYVKWGFLPGKVKDEAAVKDFYIKYTGGLNCKGDEAFNGKLYKQAIIGQRCIVLTPNFYENRHQAPSGKKTPIKYPFKIGQRGKTMNALAAVWNDCYIEATGEVRRVLSVVTTVANEAMAIVHNSKLRMPAYVRAEHFGLWLSPDPLTKEEVDTVIVPAENKEMSIVPIDKSFNAQKKDPNQPIIEYEYPELKEALQELHDLQA